MKEPLFLKHFVVFTFQVLASLIGITLLFILQLNNYLLFHYIVETLSILVGLLIFAVVWSGRDIIDNKPIIFLGIAFFFIALLDSYHMASVKGMGIIDQPNYNYQVWIVVRYLKAISILIVSIGIKKVYPKLTFIVYLAVTILLLLAIFKWQIFPYFYNAGADLTYYKIICEYGIIIILFCSLVFFLYHRRDYHKNFILMFAASIIVTILSEIYITSYTGKYSFPNGLGHILKVISYLIIYKAIFVEGIQNPQQFLFQRIYTEQNKIREKLKNSETLYQTLLGNLHQSIFFIDRDLNYVSCNTSYAQFLNLEKSEIIGRNIYDLYPKIIAEKYRQEDLDIMESGEIMDLEDSYAVGNQEIINQIVKVAVKDDDGCVIGLLGIFWNITERKKIETELENYRRHLEELVVERTQSLENTNKQLVEIISEYQKTKEVLQLHSAMIENLAEGIYLIGMDDLIIKWTNERFTKMFGYDPGDMIGKSIDIVNAPTDRTPAETRIFIMEILKETGEWHGEVENIKQDGTHFWCHASVSLFVHPEYGKVIVSVHTDISVQKQAMKDLTIARKEAESANRAKSNFLANMSHDFRTPLNAILGNTQIFLKNTKLMDQYGSSINMIHKSSLHILIMINDILDLINIEAGGIESTTSSTNFIDFLTEITKEFKHRAEEKGLSFIFENNTDPSLYLKIDKKYLHQVLYNLISNAIGFTDTGSVSLKIFCSKTSSNETDNRQKMKLILFEVGDTGIGIEKEKLESIYEPFYQEKRKKFNDRGTGMGLAISRKLIKIMGGDLHVKSTPGSGSLFWFELILEAENKKKIIKQTYRNEQTIQEKIDIKPLMIPPDEVLLRFLEMEKIGDIMGIVKLINKIEQDNDGYVSFVQKMKQLTESYQIEKFVMYINSFLSKEGK